MQAQNQQINRNLFENDCRLRSTTHGSVKMIVHWTGKYALNT